MCRLRSSSIAKVLILILTLTLASKSKMRLVLFLLLCVFVANAAPSFTVAIVVQNQPVYLRNLLRSLWTLKYHERLLVESVDVLVIEVSDDADVARDIRTGLEADSRRCERTRAVQVSAALCARRCVQRVDGASFTVARGARTLSEAYNQAWLNARSTHVVFLSGSRCTQQTRAQTSTDDQTTMSFCLVSLRMQQQRSATMLRLFHRAFRLLALRSHFARLMLNADNITVFHSFVDFRLAQIEKKKNWMTGDGENVALPVYMYQGYSKHDPRVTSQLNVEAVSRSGMIVRRDLLEQLGGFNTTFVNGLQKLA
jgi:hypothetical protein